MGYLNKIEEKITIKLLLICVLLSMWVLGLMIFSRLNQPFAVYYDSYGSLPVKVTNTVEIANDSLSLDINEPLDVKVTNDELDVEVKNEWFNPVPVEPR